MIDKFIDFFPFFTLIADTLLVFILVYWLIFRKKENDKIIVFLRNYGLILAFAFTIMATGGSLLYSEYAYYPPCKLCWFQRIFMYPQVIILGIAVWKKHESVKLNAFILSVIGSLFAVYHYLTQRFPDFIDSTCRIGETDCSFTHGFDYGYITIPIMALTAFLYIIFFTSIWQKYNK